MLHLDRGRYLAPTGARRETGAATIIETIYEAGDRLPRHAHEAVYMVVMLGGVLRETALGEEHDLSRGWIVFNSAGEAHHDSVVARGTRCLNVELRPSLLRRLADEGWRAREPLAYVHVAAAIGAVGRLYTSVLDPGTESETEEAIVELLGAVAADNGEAATGFPWLPAVLEFLHAHAGAGPGGGANGGGMMGGGVTLDALTAVAGVQRTHLCRSFRAATGCTIGEYTRRLRADAAHQRVLGGDTPLSMVAHQCGFADQSHMTRELSRRFGRSPARLRRHGPR